MFSSAVPTKFFTFGKMIRGLNQTLNIANQIIPLYQQAKPMIENARTIFRVVKTMGKNDGNENTNKIVTSPSFQTTTKKVETNSTISTLQNLPTFFL